jgi:hypothetical protein
MKEGKKEECKRGNPYVNTDRADGFGRNSRDEELGTPPVREERTPPV